MRNSLSNTELEKGLQQIFPEPNAAFVNRLEGQLMDQAARMPAAMMPEVNSQTANRPVANRPAVQQQPARRPVWQLFSLRGWVAAAAFAVVVFVVLAAVGPQNALAAVQKLLGYIPGIGFVEDPQQPVRVLAAPVQMTREGITVTVEKVLANDQMTQVRVRVDGVAQDKSLFEPGWGESFNPKLREADSNAGLDSGKTLAASGSISGAGQFIWAEYSFPPLSAGVQQVTLLLDRLPGLKAGAAPENWVLDLPLREVQSGDGVFSTTGEPGSSQRINGAQLVLDSIAAAQEQTALKLRLATDNPLRKADSEWWKGLVLLDDQGQTIALAREETLSQLNDGSVVMLAPRLDPSRRYTLRVEQSGFEYRFNPSQNAPGFRLAVPTGVQPGQTWAVDQTLEVESYRLHITNAGVVAGVRGETVLRLTIDPQADLIGVGLACQDLAVCSGSGFDLAQPDQPLTTDLILDQPLKRTIDLKAQVLLESASGPWEINFQPSGSQ